MKCPECGSEDYWEGVNGHCPNHTCRRFDQKLLDKLLNEQEDNQWDDTTQPCPITEKR